MATGAQVAFDEATTDPVALAAMFNQMESGAQPAPAEPDEATKAAAEAKAAEEEANKAAQEKATAEAAAKAQAEKEPDGVATKDGKHIIPYSVLQADRERAKRAEEALQAAQAEIDALKAAKKSEDGVAAPTPKVDVVELSEDELAVMKEDFPVQYKIYVATQAQLKALQAESAKAVESVQQVEAERERTLNEQVQDALDATPKLAHIMTTDKAAAALAKQFDNTLKNDPAWDNKPLSDRFAKVVELVETARGPITIPGQAPAAKAPPTKTADELKAEAQAAAAAAAKATKTAVPASLSEFAAGEHPAESELEALENMSPVQIAAKFASMSPDKLEAYLANPH